MISYKVGIMFPLSGTAVTIAASITLSAAYVWPNPMLDELESLHYDQRGYKNYGSSIALGVDPCSKFLFGRTPGRSNAADWIRTVSRSWIGLF